MNTRGSLSVWHGSRSSSDDWDQDDGEVGLARWLEVKDDGWVPLVRDGVRKRKEKGGAAWSFYICVLTGI